MSLQTAIWGLCAVSLWLSVHAGRATHAGEFRDARTLGLAALAVSGLGVVLALLNITGVI